MGPLQSPPHGKCREPDTESVPGLELSSWNVGIHREGVTAVEVPGAEQVVVPENRELRLGVVRDCGVCAFELDFYGGNGPTELRLGDADIGFGRAVAGQFEGGAAQVLEALGQPGSGWQRRGQPGYR